MHALPFAFPSSVDEVIDRRAEILIRLCTMDEGFSCVPVQGIRPETLKAMLSLYDQLFLGGFLIRSFGEIQVTLSPRLLSSAGKFICMKSAARRFERAEIRMSSDYLLRLNYGPFTLNGLSVATPQEAFLVVFEHELCHALETALYGKTGHSRRFLALANRLFGHATTTHSLPTRRQEAAKGGLLVGSRVRFDCEGKTLTGLVSYIGKTATVMVPCAAGAYRDQRGRRYEKYRVPLSQLEKC